MLEEILQEIKEVEYPVPEVTSAYLVAAHGFEAAKERALEIIRNHMENDGWILCSERLPEDGVDVLVWYEYFRYGEYNRLFQTTGISFTHNGEWSGFVNGQSGWNQLNIIAWQPLPNSYCPRKAVGEDYNSRLWGGS